MLTETTAKPQQSKFPSQDISVNVVVEADNSELPSNLNEKYNYLDEGYSLSNLEIGSDLWEYIHLIILCPFIGRHSL